MSKQWGRKESIITPPRVPVMSYTALAGAVLLTLIFIGQRIHSGMTPLQQTYIGTYLRSSVGGSFKHTGTYRLVYLQGGTAKPRLALPADFVEGQTTLPTGRTVPVALSNLSVVQGHRWFGLGESQKLPDASLSRWLQYAVFAGQSLPRVFAVSFIEGGICLAAMLWFSLPADYKRLRVLKYGRVLRGPVMLTPAEFNAAQAKHLSGTSFTRRFHSTWSWFAGRPPEPKAEGIGFKTTELKAMLRIPPGKEAQHIQIMGDTGAGKTQLIMQLLRQIRDRGDVAIVYDPAAEFIQRFYNKERGDIVLNPLDSRCPFWSPAMEMERNQEAVTIAESLYQPTSGTGKNEFFYRTPAQIFAHLLKEGPTPHVLADWMSDEAALQAKVLGTEMAFYIDRNAGPQAAGVLASLGLVAQSLRLLPRREDTTTVWNATDWAKERKGWIFITSQLSEREVLRPLISLWVDLLVMRLLAIPKPGQKQVWLVIDELASLQKLPQLHTAITESRKSKNPLVLGFQGKGQVEEIYGPRLAEVMLSQPATKVFLKTTEPKAAEFISETIGKVEIERLKETHFDGSRSGKNFAIDRQVEQLVMASEISGLDDRHAFMKLGNNVARFAFAYIDDARETPAFLPRRSDDDTLRFNRQTLTPVEADRHPEELEEPVPSAATPQPETTGKGGAQQELRSPQGQRRTDSASSLTKSPTPSPSQSIADFLAEIRSFQQQLEQEGRGLTTEERDAIRVEFSTRQAEWIATAKAPQAHGEEVAAVSSVERSLGSETVPEPQQQSASQTHQFNMGLD